MISCSQADFWPYLVLSWFFTFDLLNSNTNRFIFVPNCTLAVNLVKFPHEGFSVHKLLAYGHTRTDGQMHCIHCTHWQTRTRMSWVQWLITGEDKHLWRQLHSWITHTETNNMHTSYTVCSVLLLNINHCLTLDNKKLGYRKETVQLQSLHDITNSVAQLSQRKSTAG